MLRVLTQEQELALRREHYPQLTTGKLFDLGGQRLFISAEKQAESIEVIELSPENIGRILRGEPCVHSRLRFDEMSCLNVHRTQNGSREHNNKRSPSGEGPTYR